MHLCKSTENGVIHCFKDIHFVWLEALVMLVIDLLKLNNPINACLINLNVILYCSKLLNTDECLIC